MEPSDPAAPPAPRWVILVSQQHAELYDHLRQAFARDDKVQVVLDRREDHSRNPRWVNEQLRRDGVVLIRVPPTPAHSAEENEEGG